MDAQSTTIIMRKLRTLESGSVLAYLNGDGRYICIK